MEYRSFNPRARLRRVTTNLQELMFGRGRRRVFSVRPKASCISWTRRVSAMGALPDSGGTPTLGLSLSGAQLGEEGEPAVAQPAFVSWLLELGFAGVFDPVSPTGCGLD